jgi:uncharacterized membrane protein YphA (DoxX/SURF4 family)
VVQGGIYLTDGSNITLTISIAGLLSVMMGASLLIGFLTPVVSFLTGLGGITIALSWFPATSQNLFDTSLSIIFVIAMNASIFLLGPGAFSIDARLFGRREIIIPPTNRSKSKS